MIGEVGGCRVVCPHHGVQAKGNLDARLSRKVDELVPAGHVQAESGVHRGRWGPFVAALPVHVIEDFVALWKHIKGNFSAGSTAKCAGLMHDWATLFTSEPPMRSRPGASADAVSSRTGSSRLMSCTLTRHARAWKIKGENQGSTVYHHTPRRAAAAAAIDCIAETGAHLFSPTYC